MKKILKKNLNKHKSFFEEFSKKFSKFYKKNFKLLLIIPILLVLFSFFMINDTIQKEGVPIYRDVSLKGGVSLILEDKKILELNILENDLKNNFNKNSFLVSEFVNEFENTQRKGLIIDTDLEEKKLVEFLETTLNQKLILGEDYSSSFISETLSQSFFKQAIYILLVSFILMSISVFLYFKKLVPAGAVVLSAFFDIIVLVGVLDFLNFKLSIAGIGAIIMIIGYSIDTDILLTNRLLEKSHTSIFEKSFNAFTTGMLMSVSTMMASLIAIFFTNSNIIYEISFILFIGLLVDMISTWIQNLSLLLMWLEKK